MDSEIIVCSRCYKTRFLRIRNNTIAPMELSMNNFYDRRQEARKKFHLFDAQAQPLNLRKQSAIEIQLKPTAVIIVTGYLPREVDRFAINLTCKRPGNIAFHFNSRFESGHVVRNSMRCYSWENEETSLAAGASSSTIFQHDAYFHIGIFCTVTEFLVVVNGEHCCDFRYRFPLETIDSLEIIGSIEDVRTRLTNLCINPGPEIYEPSSNLKLNERKPVFEGLKVPVTISIDQEFRHGLNIFIKGRLESPPHFFYVNLQRGQMTYSHPEIALHVNTRFQCGSQTAYYVMNSWTEGTWNDEERHEGPFSCDPERDFLLTIRCESESYVILLDDEIIGEFKHRLHPTIVDTLVISGDVFVHAVAMSSEENISDPEAVSEGDHSETVAKIFQYAR